jgi:hypothetical protein
MQYRYGCSFLRLIPMRWYEGLKENKHGKCITGKFNVKTPESMK